MNFYRGKKVLVTGGTGLIGIPLVKQLLDYGAHVRIASLDPAPGVNKEAEFVQGNLTDWVFCQKIVKNIDFVFHLAGTKGAVSVGRLKAASFFVPHLIFNTLMMEAARLENINRYLFTSTIGIYPPAPIFYEDHAWEGPPHPSNSFAGWAKRMGELQAESYKLEFGWDKIAIVRPANVYGPFDYFEESSSMVIPSLIRKAVQGEQPFTVWGDGSAIRDFVYSEDVAQGMLLALEKGANCTPMNLGSGKGYSIRELVNIISSYIPGLDIQWDTSKPKGEDSRILSIERAKNLIEYDPKVSLREGIGRTIEWYQKNKFNMPTKYKVFTEKKLIC